MVARPLNGIVQSGHGMSLVASTPVSVEGMLATSASSIRGGHAPVVVDARIMGGIYCVASLNLVDRNGDAIQPGEEIRIFGPAASMKSRFELLKFVGGPQLRAHQQSRIHRGRVTYQALMLGTRYGDAGEVLNILHRSSAEVLCRLVGKNNRFCSVEVDCISTCLKHEQRHDNALAHEYLEVTLVDNDI